MIELSGADVCNEIVNELRETALYLQSFAVEPEMTHGCLMDVAADLIESQQSQLDEQ